TIKLPSAEAEYADSKQHRGQKTRKLSETPILKGIEEQIILAVERANKEIIRHGEQHASTHGLGCTVTLAFIEDDRAYIANVGDSRTYLLRDGKLSALTKDHSLVAKLVEAKQIEQSEVYSHPQRNLIYRSLGANHKTVEVDVFQET